jgi:hypothetical protein
MPCTGRIGQRLRFNTGNAAPHAAPIAEVIANRRDKLPSLQATLLGPWPTFIAR